MINGGEHLAALPVAAPAPTAPRPEDGGRTVEGESAPPPPPATLAQRTIGAAQWRLATSGLRGVLQFGVSVLLAHLLPPSAFGLVALALAVVGLATLMSELGFGRSVVQREDLTPRHVRVAFWGSLVFGATLGLLLVAVAPLAGTLLNEPRLPSVLRWLALMFVFGGVGVTARGVLQRELDLRRLFFVEVGSYVVGYALVAVTLALLGYGVWSLVAGALVQSLLASGFAYVAVRHSLVPLFARRELGELLSFGTGASLNGLVNYVARNGDNLLVGRWLGAHPLGLYNRAFVLMGLPLEHVGSALEGALFPALSRVQGDQPRMARAYLFSVETIAVATMPVMAGMIVAAPHLVQALYGPAWLGSALPLQILCAVGALRTIMGAAGAVTHATGEVYAEARRQAAYALCVLAGTAAGVPWGIAGVACGVAVAVLVVYLAMAQLALRLVGRGWREFFRAQVPGTLVGAAVVAAAVPVRLGLEELGASAGWITLALIVASGAAAALGLRALPASLRPTEMLRQCERIIARLPARARPPAQWLLRLPDVEPRTTP